MPYNVNTTLQYFPNITKFKLDLNNISFTQNSLTELLKFSLSKLSKLKSLILVIPNNFQFILDVSQLVNLEEFIINSRDLSITNLKFEKLPNKLSTIIYNIDRYQNNYDKIKQSLPNITGWSFKCTKSKLIYYKL